MKPWFPAKKYGYGWGLPITWQGWFVFLLYLIFVGLAVYHINTIIPSDSQLLYQFIPEIIASSLLFIFICYLTGEKPHWSFGDKKKKKR